jgi:hypothetical protein
LCELVSEKAAEVLFHDLAGLFMCFLAATLLWLELRFLSRLYVPVRVDESLARQLVLEHAERQGTPV